MILGNDPQKQCGNKMYILSLSRLLSPCSPQGLPIKKWANKNLCPTSEILTFIDLLDISSKTAEKQNKKYSLVKSKVEKGSIRPIKSSKLWKKIT